MFDIFHKLRKKCLAIWQVEKYLIIFAITTGILSFSFWIVLPKINYYFNNPELLLTVAKTSETKKVSNSVMAVHRTINYFVCWGRESFFDDSAWQEYDNTYEEIKKQIEKAVAEVKNEALKEDLKTVLGNLELARKTHIVHHLISSHRILHDLDYFYFYNPPDNRENSRDYFGVTKTIEASKEETSTTGSKTL